MQAMVVTEFGGPDVLHMQEIAEPVPGEHDLLVAVHASSVNPVDCKIRQAGLGQPREFPFALGFDVSGVVEAVGDKVEKFKVGDEIYASPNLGRHGANAQRVLVDHRAAAHRPQRIDHQQAALYPLVTLTAWEALFRHAGLHHGETVLIHAGGGGVGHIAIQLAKDHGCRVIATASRGASRSLCESLGADVVIDYKQEDVVARVQQETGGRGCDVVFETVGGKNFDISIPLTAVHGRLVAILGTPEDAKVSDLFFKNASLHFEFMGAAGLFGVGLEHQGEILQTAAEMIDAGKLKVHTEKVFSLEDLAEAHRLQETGHVTGKVGVRVR